MPNAPEIESPSAATAQPQKRHKRTATALVAALLLLALGFAAYRAYREENRLRHIVVLGAERTTSSDVREALALTHNDFLHSLDPVALAARVRTLEAVADATVEIEPPDTIVVHLVEQPSPGRAEGAEH